jgi:hypothetical protein
MRTAVYARLRDPRHEMLAAYAKKHDFTINEVLERLVDQLLIQVEPRFRAPPWIVAAIRGGYLPFALPDSVEEETEEGDPIDEGAPRILRAL